MKLCEAFIRVITRYEVAWSPQRSAQHKDEDGNPQANRPKLAFELADFFKTAEVIMHRTEVITPVIIMPFALVFLTLVARSTLFDGWEWNPQLVFIYLALTVYLLIRALALQRQAERGRDRIIMHISRFKTELLDPDQSSKLDDREIMRIERLRTQADEVVERIRSLNRGAFVPWQSHPIVQALLLPFTGLSTLALMQSFL